MDSILSNGRLPIACLILNVILPDTFLSAVFEEENATGAKCSGK
jgi:hypothetical protein